MGFPSRSRLFAVALTAAFTLPAFHLHATDTTWDGSESSNWLDPLNWDTGSVPTSADNTFINSGDVTLSGTAETRILRMGNLADSEGTFTLESGSLLAGAASQSGLGVRAGSVSTLIQNGGDVTINHDFRFGGVTSTIRGGSGTYIMNGGTLTLSASSSALQLAYSAGASSSGYYYQNDGSVTVGSLDIGAIRYTATSVSGNVNNALYEISGGDLTVNGAITVGEGTDSGLGEVVAGLTVKGSSATINANSLTINNNSQNTSTLSYTLDNGGVSKINLTSSATLAGTLEANLNGGMTLTTGNTFNLVEANTGAITNNLSTLPNSSLWDVAVVTLSGGTRDALQLSLNGAAQQGTIATGEAATFGPATVGYVILTGLNTGSNVDIYLNVDAGTGQSIADYVNYLTSNGIVASTTSETGYTVVVSMEAGAETSYYTWDLNDFSSDATVAGVMLIPEPASTAALAGLAVIGFAYLRRRARR